MNWLDMLNFNKVGLVSGWVAVKFGEFAQRSDNWRDPWIGQVSKKRRRNHVLWVNHPPPILSVNPLVNLHPCCSGWCQLPYLFPTIGWPRIEVHERKIVTSSVRRRPTKVEECILLWPPPWTQVHNGTTCLDTSNFFLPFQEFPAWLLRAVQHGSSAIENPNARCLQLIGTYGPPASTVPLLPSRIHWRVLCKWSDQQDLMDNVYQEPHEQHDLEQACQLLESWLNSPVIHGNRGVTSPLPSMCFISLYKCSSREIFSPRSRPCLSPNITGSLCLFHPFLDDCISISCVHK